ncbi:lasso peptide biosynthesis PqqD family chaperone [Bacillus salipaludis]|uniref:lasso peptide biosynthesis PqqD family chaperone n=1 Tax=Bacillus salipaludis TaxID=2547811 RepID=UPI003D1E8626
MIKNHTISLNNIVVQGSGNIVSDMDGEKVMLSILNGKYYNLGEVGGRIWEQIEQPIAVNQLIDNLMSYYQVEKTDCENQVISFLEVLLNRNLIQVEEVDSL